MESDLWIRKYFVVGIILTLLIPCLISSTAHTCEKIFVPTSNGTWFYVGGSGVGNYTKIQDAIDNTSDGDTVFLYSGIYNEVILIKKNQLTLKGQDKNITILHFNQTYPIFQNAIIQINAHTCTIENLQITLRND